MIFPKRRFQFLWKCYIPTFSMLKGFLPLKWRNVKLEFKVEGNGYSYMFDVTSFLDDPGYDIPLPFKVSSVSCNTLLIHYVVSHILVLKKQIFVKISKKKYEVVVVWWIVNKVEIIWATIVICYIIDRKINICDYHLVGW